MLFFFSGMFSKLLKTTDKFFEKFNIRRLKLGTIMAFLERLNMMESKTAIARVLRKIKVCINDKKVEIYKPVILMDAKSR